MLWNQQWNVALVHLCRRGYFLEWGGGEHVLKLIKVMGVQPY